MSKCQCPSSPIFSELESKFADKQVMVTTYVGPLFDSDILKYMPPVAINDSMVYLSCHQVISE